MEAGYLLKHFPVLYEQALQQAEDALVGNMAFDVTNPQRRGKGKHSDPTGKRAVALAEANLLASKLALIRRWIDEELSLEDRPLLLSVWRNSWCGWRGVSKETGLGVGECQRRWNELTQQLADWLEVSP
jgi:hypothetical protein